MNMVGLTPGQNLWELVKNYADYSQPVLPRTGYAESQNVNST